MTLHRRKLKIETFIRSSIYIGKKEIENDGFQKDVIR